MSAEKFQKEVTFTIKTFERPKQFQTLIKSLAKQHPWCKVLIVDDSKVPYAKSMLERRRIPLYWEVLESPYDIGLGAGRNLLVSKVETPYFVLLDDDYEFQKPVFYDMLRHLKERGVNLVACTLWNTRRKREDAICRDVWVEGNKMYHSNLPFEGKWAEAPMVNNCFIAETDPIRNLGWDAVFKIAGEHSDFALRAYEQNLKFHILRVHGALHHPERPRAYARMRNRSHASLLLDKYGCTELHQHNEKVLRIKDGTDYRKRALQIGRMGV